MLLECTGGEDGAEGCRGRCLWAGFQADGGGIKVANVAGEIEGRGIVFHVENARAGNLFAVDEPALVDVVAGEFR